MLRFKLAVLIGLLLVFISVPAAVAVSATDPTGLEVFLDGTMQTKMEKYHIPNATVSVVKEGEIVYKKGFGLADIERRVPVDADATLFRIGSTSKLITWTAVMRLVEEGKLDLDADVNTYLDFEIPSRLAKSLKKTATGPITLTHLMTHTPGFEDYPDRLFRLSADGLQPLDQYIKANLPSRIFPAGEVAAYSNYGTALAGYIVERVSGLPFSEYVEKNIFLPLGMTKSTFRQPVPSDRSPLVAKPYRFVEGAYAEGEFEYLLPEPAGSMSSTALDMSRFMMAHLGGDADNGLRVLGEETLKKMQRQHFTHHPALGGMTLGFMEGSFNNQGVLFHGGGTMLYSTGLYLVPGENLGIFMSYSGGNHLLHSEVFQEFMDQYYPVEAPLAKTPPEGSKERAREFAGEYQMNRRSLTTAEKITSLLMGAISVAVDEDGYLLVTNGGETNRFVEIEPGMYQNLREGRTQDYFGPFRKIVFQTDPYGRVMLTTDGPMTYSKAPFYASLTFTASALVIILLTLTGSLLYWTVAKFVGLFRREKNRNPRLATLAQWAGICFSIAVLAFVVGTLSSGDIDPVYQLPKEAYAPVAGKTPLDFIPTLVMVLGLSLLPLAVVVWRKGFWQRVTRIHYTLFAVAAFGLMWMFAYWNLIE